MKKWQGYASIAGVLLFVSYASAAAMENTTFPSPLNFWFIMLSLFTGVGALVSGVAAITEWEISGP